MGRGHEALPIFLFLCYGAAIIAVRPPLSSPKLPAALGQETRKLSSRGHKQQEGPLSPHVGTYDPALEEAQNLNKPVPNIDIEEPETVGVPYQEPTPLLSGHRDVKHSRDAKSYAAEAARCMNEVVIRLLLNTTFSVLL
jgi:hypothetical protein